MSEDEDLEDGEVVIIEDDDHKEEQSNQQPHDDDDEDERLAESDDDNEDEITDRVTNRDKRQKRKEVRKRAEERAKRELAMLREQVSMLNQRLSATEGRTLSFGESQLDKELQEAQMRVQQAEMIMSRAMEAGNGEDHTTAMRIRDAEQQRLFQLSQVKQQYQQQQRAPVVNPMVQSYAQQWLNANPWYDPTGRDEDSRITKAIDDGLAREGYDPSSLEYWEELTSRVSSRLNTDNDSGSEPVRNTRRKAPPMGNTREHAPGSTRNEIFVTPERKQAMMDAGIWDDPTRRNQMLKAYQAYDRENKSAR